MSAAEPADPVTPPAMTSERDAAVIDLTTRTSRTATRGRRRHVSDPQPERQPDPGPASLQQQLAEDLEMTFNHHNLSLSDEMTAAVFGVTLQIVRDVVLKGGQGHGIITETQRLKLDQVVEGMTGAPRLIEG